MNDPEHRQKLESSWKNKTETQRSVASARFKVMNQNLAFREAQAESLRGKPFAGVRGGNGSISPHQEALGRELSMYELEYHLTTGDPSWRCVAIDLARPDLKIAIEVDGPSHLSKKQQARDTRKTAILNRLGWMVVRVPNAAIDLNVKEVARSIRGLEQAREHDLSTISKSKTPIVTSPTEFS